MSNLPKSLIFLIETVCVAGSYTITLRLFAPSAIFEGLVFPEAWYATSSWGGPLSKQSKMGMPYVECIVRGLLFECVAGPFRQ